MFDTEKLPRRRAFCAHGVSHFGRGRETQEKESERHAECGIEKDYRTVAIGSGE